MIGITGHRVIDVDTYISMLLMEKALKQQGYMNVRMVLLQDRCDVDRVTLDILNKLNISLCEKCNNVDEITEWVFVDHTDYLESVGKNVKVKGVIDHHSSERQYSDLAFEIREASGSAAQLVLKYMNENNLDITKDMLYLALVALIVDTNGLTNVKAQAKDKEFAEEVAKKLKIDLSYLLEEFTYESVWESSRIECVALNGFKEYKQNDYCFTSSYLDFKGITESKSKKLDEVYKYLEKYAKDTDGHILLVTDIKERVSFVKVFGKLKEIVKFPSKFEYVASRGKTIIPSVFEQIAKNTN